MTRHCIAHCSAYGIRGNVVSRWRSFVTTQLVSLLGLKNRHGHWLCWMSTGRKDGLMWRTYTLVRRYVCQEPRYWKWTWWCTCHLGSCCSVSTVRFTCTGWVSTGKVMKNTTVPTRMCPCRIRSVSWKKTPHAKILGQIPKSVIPDPFEPKSGNY